MVHLDPHIPFIPAFLLNFVLGVLAPYIFNQARCWRVRRCALWDAQSAGRPQRHTSAASSTQGSLACRLCKLRAVLTAPLAVSCAPASR